MDLLGSRKHRTEFEEFVQLNSTRLLRTAVLLLGERAAAEDLVQQALLATLIHWHRARLSPMGYATQAVVNLCRDRWRREAGRHRRTLGEQEYERHRALNESVDPTGDHLDAGLAHSTLVEAMRSLPERQREVLVLRFYLEHSIPEIGNALGIPEGTVKSSLSRAIGRMREILLPEHSSLVHDGGA
jgi:RNA polymerase sigma factor (sigma-70 family)